MDEDKKDFWIGLLFFVSGVLCICLNSIKLNGDPVYYMIFKQIGISPGIRLGSGYLYVYSLVILVGLVISVKKCLKHWWHYGQRFRDYHICLRYLPALIAVAAILAGTNAHKIYFRILGNQDGIKAVACYKNNNAQVLEYTNKDGLYQFTYDFILQNYGDEPVDFYVYLKPDESHVQETYRHWQHIELAVNNEKEESKRFTLAPNERSQFKGESTNKLANDGSSGSGRYTDIQLILVDEDGIRHTIKAQ